MSSPRTGAPSPYLLALLRASLFGLSPVENGGAELYPFSPFGGAQPLLARVAELTGLAGPRRRPGPLEAGVAARAASVYLDFLEALPGLLATADLTPGEYTGPSVARGLRELSEGRDLDDPETAAATEAAFAGAIADGFRAFPETLQVDATLLALARASVFRLQWNFEPWGPFHDAAARKAAAAELVAFERDAEAAPPGTPFVCPVQAVDGKRPYGPRTYYYWDLEDLRVPGVVAEGPPEHGRAAFTGPQQAALNALHRQTPLVFQALARHGRWG